MVLDPEMLPNVGQQRDADKSSGASQISLARHRWRRYVLGMLLFVPFCVAGIYYLRSATPARSASEETTVLSVDVMTVAQVNRYAIERAYTGELVAGRSTALGFELMGTVVDILVDEGDRVVAGQQLARLDTRTLQAQRQQVEAQRQQALAQLSELEAGPRQEDIDTAQAAVAEVEQQLILAQLQRDRREELHADGAISREELDQEIYSTAALEKRLIQAQSELAELQAGTRSEQLNAQAARVKELDAQLQQIDVDLEKSVLYAPFDGTINERAIDEGAVTSSGQAWLSLLEAGFLEARVGIPPEVADTLAVGSEQTVLLGERTYAARITALLPAVDDISRTVIAVLEMPGVDLTVGQTVRLLLTEMQDASGFWLSTTALVPGERGLWSVYVLSEPAADLSDNPSAKNIYTVGRRDVEVIHPDGDRSLVRGTLQAGEQVIVSGAHRVVPREHVRVRQRIDASEITTD